MDTQLADTAYRDAARPIDERTDDLLARTTLDESIAQRCQLRARSESHTPTAGTRAL